MARIDELFRYLKDNKGSDLHIAAGVVPRIRASGSLQEIEGWPVLDHAGVESLLHEIANDHQWADYQACGDLDFAYSLPGVARFRCNFLRQENGAGAVFRIIPEKILTCEQLKMPEAIANLADLQQGMVLITGPTGSGKSTTLAAVIDRINTNYQKHILTIEDPVEFVHPNRGCVFSQREVHHDSHSFADALKVAVRQDADVVLVGEMRDLETISIAVTAAEMGILVMGTLHTNGAAQTVDRIVNSFPADKQSHIRTMISTSLRGVISQQLLPTKHKPGRIAALEIMINTPAVANLIRQGKLDQLETAMQSGGSAGMQTMDNALMDLVDKRWVSGKEAYQQANNKSKFAQVKDQS